MTDHSLVEHAIKAEERIAWYSRRVRVLEACLLKLAEESDDPKKFKRNADQIQVDYMRSER